MNKLITPAILLTCFLLVNIVLNGQEITGTKQSAGESNLPVASICGLNTGMIDKDTLIKADSLFCSWKDNEIISFTMFRYADELTSKSTLLTREMKKAIGEMRSGSKLCFFDIKARTPDGKTILLSPIILKIK